MNCMMSEKIGFIVWTTKQRGHVDGGCQHNYDMTLFSSSQGLRKVCYSLYYCYGERPWPRQLIKEHI